MKSKGKSNPTAKNDDNLTNEQIDKSDEEIFSFTKGSKPLKITENMIK